MQALHLACGTLPKEHADCPAVFFARGSAGGALAKDAMDTLSHGLLAQGTPSLQLLDQVPAHPACAKQLLLQPWSLHHASLPGSSTAVPDARSFCSSRTSCLSTPP